ncbi:endophilin-B1-like [Artemia franciscana]|uniref:endophilin-B1-like n=1 Tax=Artemia franciscana TaxID=6661 RepID=UPI0032DA6BC3
MDLKKLVGDASVFFSRAVQLTEEKLGTSDKTELDAHYENLVNRTEQTIIWTEKLVQDVDILITPKPSNRVEDYIMEKIEGQKPRRLNNLECLGSDMIRAGNEVGPGTAYGSTLIKVGAGQQKLGLLEKEFATSATSNFIDPLRRFLENDVRTYVREKKDLENKRLDLGAVKNKLKKAKNASQDSIEREVRLAQGSFDRQAEITKLLMEGILVAHSSHLRHLQDLVAAQAKCYAACHAQMQDLQRELSNASGLYTGTEATGTRPDADNTPLFRLNSEEIDLNSPTSP